MRFNYLTTVLIIFCFCSVNAQTSKNAPLKFAYKMLQANEVQATGWLKTQAVEDLKEGLPGRLKDINSDITNEVFAKQNLAYIQKGVPTWWPGEQEGYWYEGLVHLAFQANDKNAILHVTEWIEKIMNAQTNNGYIGIYAPEYQLIPVTNPLYGENGGELHTQAHVFLAMIAFYEHTGRKEVLVAVERAIQLSMKTYKNGVFGTAGKRTPLTGGNSHVVTFADPLIQLYRLTGKIKYLEFVGLMFSDYNQHPPRDKDYMFATLNDSNSVYTGHGAHTAESFHLVQAAALIGDESIKKLPAIAAKKLLRHITPGGALVSDEMIDGKIGNGVQLYEHCTQNELIKSFNFVAQYTGDPAMSERTALLFFNGIQGARLHPLKAVQYLSRDDRMDIPTDSVKIATNIRNEGSHFQMSSIIRPTCCSASAGRALPYYIASMWMKSIDNESIVVMNFGSSNVNTTLNGVSVNIVEETDYPFNDKIVFTVNPIKTVAFDLNFRLPLGGDLKVIASSGAKITKLNGMLQLTKKWKKGDRIKLELIQPIVLEKTQDGSAWYYRRGAIVYALPFDSKVTAVTENPRLKDGQPSGLFEYDVQVVDKTHWGYRIDPTAKFQPVKLNGDNLHPWEKPTFGIKGTMIDKNDKIVEVTLVPEGAAVSRRVTFLDKSHTAEEAGKLPKGSKIGIGY